MGANHGELMTARELGKGHLMSEITPNQVDNATQGVPAASERTFTQAEMDAIISDRLKRERAKYADYNELQAKAAKFDEAEEASKSEQEKANARAEAAESELAVLKAEKAKNDAARKLASETGVSFEMLMFCSDEEAMSEFAKTYAKENHVSSAPKANSGSRIVKGGETKKDAKQVFAEFAAENLKF